MVKNERYDLYGIDGTPKETPLRYREGRSIIATGVQADSHAVITFKPDSDSDHVNFGDMYLNGNSTFVEPQLSQRQSRYVLNGTNILMDDNSDLVMGKC